eukprot:7842333-Alexandrium_andersonii.AAC.1
MRALGGRRRQGQVPYQTSLRPRPRKRPQGGGRVGTSRQPGPQGSDLACDSAPRRPSPPGQGD